MAIKWAAMASSCNVSSTFLLFRIQLTTHVDRAANRMASSAFVAGSPVPDWVRRNGEIFRTPPQGTDLSKRRRSFEGTVERKQDAVGRAGGGRAARLRAEMSEDDGLGTIVPPALLPPASYYQDVRNHANIATTMLVTARHAVGFQPSLAGEVSPQQMDDFVDKFYKWIFELDNYWPYIDIKGSQVRALWFHSGDENRINEDVSNFLGSFSGLKDEVIQAWRQSLTGMVKGASAYVTEHGADVSQVSFQMDILDTSGNRDLVQPLTFGRTVQSNPPNGKYDSVLTSGMTYLVDSSEIIASADYFAQNGISIFGAKEYVAYVNSGS